MLCPTCSTANPEGAAACRACGSPLQGAGGAADPYALPPGTLLQGGAYRIERVLGQGGFGITYAGRDLTLQRQVAIKEFFPTGSTRVGPSVQPGGGVSAAEFAAFRARFLEEARVLARFQHPGIVQVFASFEERNTAYMVMELLRGKSLADLLEERGPLPEAELLPQLERVGEALAVVHDAGLLHRDLKPDNLMWTDDGRVVLIDFGTAREFTAGKTHRMTTMLTPGYAPLEQYSQQARFGTFTDVYALAATFYHLLTGQLPVSALDRVQGVALPAPHTLRPEIRRGVSDALMWALEMKVADRPSSARELLTALRAGAAPKAGAAKSAARPLVANDAAVTVEDVIRLCEAEPETAERQLYSGELERRLAHTLRGTALSSFLRETVARHPRERWKGLELLLRELHRSQGEDPYPRLEPDPPQLDLGEHPVGARATASLRLRNRGRGHAWGTVSVQPVLPGLSVPAEFHSATARIEVSLDTLRTAPGEYQGQVTLAAEGVPAPVVVPVRYRVVPLEVTVEPRQLDLGTVAAGTKASAMVRLLPVTAGGRLAGTARLSRFAEGVAVTPTLSGAAPEVQLSVDTRTLPAGQLFRADLVLETNAGTFTLPVRFRVSFPWRPVTVATLRGAVSWGMGLALGRLAIAMAIGPRTWLSESPARPESLAPVWVVVLGVWIALGVSTGTVRRALGARVNTWAGVKWVLLSLALGCSGLLVALSGLGTGLLSAFDRIGHAFLAPLLPVGAWLVLGALLGALFGAGPGLIRAGRPRSGVALHWLSLGMTFVLAVWGWLWSRSW